jgi:hypothetical protein
VLEDAGDAGGMVLGGDKCEITGICCWEWTDIYNVDDGEERESRHECVGNITLSWVASNDGKVRWFSLIVSQPVSYALLSHELLCETSVRKPVDQMTSNENCGLVVNSIGRCTVPSVWRSLLWLAS